VKSWWLRCGYLSTPTKDVGCKKKYRDLNKNVPTSLVYQFDLTSAFSSMERAQVMRVMSSQVVHLELSSGAIVCAQLSDPYPESLGLVKANALRPIPVEVELGPYVTKDKRFVDCKISPVAVAPPMEGVTTKFRRIKK